MEEITIDKKILITLVVVVFISLAGMVAIGLRLESERQKVAELEEQTETVAAAELVHETLSVDTCTLLDMYEFDTWHVDKYSDYTLRVTKGNMYLRFENLKLVSDIHEKAKEAYQTFKVINEKDQ